MWWVVIVIIELCDKWVYRSPDRIIQASAQRDPFWNFVDRNVFIAPYFLAVFCQAHAIFIYHNYQLFFLIQLGLIISDDVIKKMWSVRTSNNGNSAPIAVFIFPHRSLPLIRMSVYFMQTPIRGKGTTLHGQHHNFSFVKWTQLILSIAAGRVTDEGVTFRFGKWLSYWIHYHKHRCSRFTSKATGQGYHHFDRSRRLYCYHYKWLQWD